MEVAARRARRIGLRLAGRRDLGGRHPRRARCERLVRRARRDVRSRIEARLLYSVASTVCIGCDVSIGNHESCN